MAIFDINFRPSAFACLCIEADSLEHAEEIAEQEIAKLSKKELFERLQAAIDYEGWEIEVEEA